MVTINVFFPFGELSSRLHPPKKTKKQIQIIILEKRGLYFELEREKTIRRYKNIYFNGHLWCKYHTNTTSIPTKSPIWRWKSKIPPPVTINVYQNFYGIFIQTDPVRIEKTTGYSGREMNEIYWKLVSRAAHPLINQLLWFERNETELQFGLNNFHSGFWRKPPHWSILIFLSDWFNFADFSLANENMISEEKMIFDKVQFGFISSIIQNRSGSYYRKERQLPVPPYIGLVPFIGLVRHQFGKMSEISYFK